MGGLSGLQRAPALVCCTCAAPHLVEHLLAFVESVAELRLVLISRSLTITVISVCAIKAELQQRSTCASNGFE